MANPQHVAIFKEGVASWNRWRKANPGVEPDLSGESFGFIGSRLHRYSKPGVNTAVFGRFTTKDYTEADLSRAKLSRCIFREVNLSRASFREADLSDSEFRQISMLQADLSGVDLRRARFILTALDEVEFEGAIFGSSHFGYSPLRSCQGLKGAVFDSESHMDFLTLRHSTELPSEFISHFGVDPRYYEKIRALQGASYSDCFISYSTKNEEFARLLRDTLITKGIPCWFAPGDYRLNTQWSDHELSDYEVGRDLFNFIDASEIVLLLLSPHSLKSRWVDEEMTRAFQARRVIPLLLEDINLKEIEEERHWYEPVVRNGVMDFRNWKDAGWFEQQIEHLVPRLKKKQV